MQQTDWFNIEDNLFSNMVPVQYLLPKSLMIFDAPRKFARTNVRCYLALH